MVLKKGPCGKAKLQGRSVTMYTDLLLDTTLSVQAKLFQAFLQLTSGFKEATKNFKYSSLSRDFHVSVRTARNAIKQLVQSGWLAIKQANQHAPVFFSLRHPIKEQFKAIHTTVVRNIFTAKFKGEALMKEFLSLLVYSKYYMDNPRVGFLRNPETDSLMEFDRCYPNHRVAFEFNGTQHFMPTDFYGTATVEKQQFRDSLKKKISSDSNIELVIIQPHDLTLDGMLKKIGNLLPLRNLRGAEKVIRYLERYSAAYRKNTPELASIT